MKKLVTHHLFPIVTLVTVSALFYLLWRSNSPYPSALNWDIWEHQTAINAIRSGSFALLPSGLSDTFRFDGYTTVFHMIIAGLQQVFQIKDILGFWWVAEGVFFALTTLAAYAFSYVITRSRIAATIAGVLSASFFESAVAFTTLFLLPQTVTALLWVLGMTIATLQQSHRQRMITALVFSLILLPIHAIVGAYGALFLFLYALRPTMSTTRVLAATIGAALAGYLIPTYIANRFALGSINAGEAQYFTQTIGEKLKLFTQWYGWLPVPFLVLGLWQTMKTKNSPVYLLAILFAGSIGLVLSVFPYILKFVVISRYIMLAIIAVGCATYAERLKSMVARLGSLCAIGTAGWLVFFANTTQWKNSVVFRGIASHVSIDERAAATALMTRYGSANAFLISDPATQYILEPLSGINSQGGAYMDVSTRVIIAEAFRANNAQDVTASLVRIQDMLHKRNGRTMLLVVSGRTFKWLAAGENDRMSISYNIWRPEALSLQNDSMIETWKHQFELTEVYRNPSMVVFELGETI